MDQAENDYRAFGVYRFVLALLVVVSHTWDLSYEKPEDHLLCSIGLGNIGVMTFFVLSGFIISEAVDHFYRERPFSFLVNRFLRLVPPFLAALLISVVVHAALVQFSVRTLPSQYFPSGMFSIETLLVNVTDLFPILNFNKVFGQKDYYHFVSYAWAVFVEFVFYLSVFGACVLSAHGVVKKSATPRTIAYFFGVVFLLIHMYNEYIHKLYGPLSFVPYFLLGVLFYQLRKGKSRTILVAGVLVFSFMLLHFTRYIQGQIALDSEWLDSVWRVERLVPTVLIALVPLIIYPLSYTNVSQKLKSVDRWFGDLAYPLYLNHYAVVVIFFTLFETRKDVYQLTAIALSLVLAYAMKIIVETPLRQVRDSIRGTVL
jgi:peptidoglycan/LPS O-acetylase OafA/YrhL